jgi:hypothetical protein
MQADRYVKIVLTVIAIELGWLALADVAQPVSAQAQSAPTRVVIAGIELGNNRLTYLPVGIAGVISHNQVPQPATLRIDTTQQPLRVDVPSPIDVRTVGGVQIEPGDRPIKTEAMPFVPQPRPGL